MESFEAIWGGAPLPYLQVKADALQPVKEWRRPLSDEANFRHWVENTPHTFCSPHVIPEKELKRYLGSVDEEGTYFRWQVNLSQREIIQTLHRHHGISAQRILSLQIKHRGGSGRINRLDVHYADLNGKEQIFKLTSEYAVRQSLHSKFLYSSAFTIEAQEENFILKGAGWGHGVGLCQIGALGMALNGYSTKEILYHYYPGSTLEKIY
jgi:SpoIID/LytB domain protein